jgi:hypothetical protein
MEYLEFSLNREGENMIVDLVIENVEYQISLSVFEMVRIQAAISEALEVPDV